MFQTALIACNKIENKLERKVKLFYVSAFSETIPQKNKKN